MLGHSLAILVGLGSVTLYLAAFFFPEVHRKHDFFWSGVGCFYGLVLWFCAGQISPTEALGHGASLSLLAWLGWQTLTLRRKRTPLDLQTPLTEDSWQTFRRELVSLGQAFVRQTPLGRWLPAPNQQGSGAMNTSGTTGELRASSLKDVGYEFLDELAPDSSSPAKTRLGPEINGTSSPSNGAAPAVAKARKAKATAISSKSPPPKPAAVATNQGSKPNTWIAKARVIQTWVQDLVKATLAPKPKKPVIEIPPRSSNTVSSGRRLDNAGHPSEFQEASAGANHPPVIKIVDTQAVESSDNPEDDNEVEG